MHPDGGVARLRVHGESIPDPRLLDLGALDLAALENGAVWQPAAANTFYSSPNNLFSPGLAAHQARGLGDRPQVVDNGKRLGQPCGSPVPGSSDSPSIDTQQLEGQRAWLGVTARLRRDYVRCGRSKCVGWTCCRAPGCSPTPAPGLRWSIPARSPMSGSTSSPTAAWRALRLFGGLNRAGPKARHLALRRVSPRDTKSGLGLAPGGDERRCLKPAR